MFLGLLRPNPFISDMTDIFSNKRYLSSCRWVKCEPQNPQNNRQEELKILFNLFAWAALVFAKIKLGVFLSLSMIQPPLTVVQTPLNAQIFSTRYSKSSFFLKKKDDMLPEL
jgi:hypothetical protein